jgi:hypothetical protein
MASGTPNKPGSFLPLSAAVDPLTYSRFAEPGLSGKAHLGGFIHLLSPRHPLVRGGAESCLEVGSCSHFPLSVTSSFLHYAPHIRGILRVVLCHEVPLPGPGLCEIGLGAHPLRVKDNSLVDEFLRLRYRHGQQAQVPSRVLNGTNLQSLLLKAVSGDPSHICRILEEGQVYVNVATDVVHLCVASVHAVETSEVDPRTILPGMHGLRCAINVFARKEPSHFLRPPVTQDDTRLAREVPMTGIVNLCAPWTLTL